MHLFFKLLIFLLFLNISTVAFGIERYQVNYFSPVQDQVNELLRRGLSPEEILVTFDLDNTILIPDLNWGALGSDQWYSWQASLLSDEHHPLRLASSVTELLKITTLVRKYVPSTLTQLALKTTILSLERYRVHMITLTSRGPRMKPVTLDALDQLKIDFSKSSLPLLLNYDTPFSPLQLNENVSSGFTLSNEEISKYLPVKPRNTTYSHGIFFSEGQNKGAILRMILANSRQPIHALIFIDDEKENCDQVEQAFMKFLPGDFQVTINQYMGEEERKDRFRKSDKSKETMLWDRIKDKVIPAYKSLD